MEQKIITLLSFDVYAPTRLYFCVRMCHFAKVNAVENDLLMYLLELSLQDMALNVNVSSLVAAAALHLTLQVMCFKIL
jgi:hypothetical protein